MERVHMEDDLYLVTGAGGFVGGFLVDHLLAEGKRVRAMVRKESQRADLEARGAEVVLADLQDEASLGPAVAGCRGVYHIASMFREQPSDAVFHEINVEGVRRMLDAAIAAGVQRFVHCSTVGVLGHIDTPPANEDTPYAPCDIYQSTKMEGEKVALEYFRGGKIPGVVIRPAMIYGPTDQRTAQLFVRVARGKFFFVGPSKVLHHWIDVRDLARSFRLGMEHEERNGEVYIIPGAEPVELRHMCSVIAEKAGVKAPGLTLPLWFMVPAAWLCETAFKVLPGNPPLHLRKLGFFTKTRHFDGSKAAREIGFEPAQTLEQEVDDIIASYRKMKLI